MNPIKKEHNNQSMWSNYNLVEKLRKPHGVGFGVTLAWFGLDKLAHIFQFWFVSFFVSFFCDFFTLFDQNFITFFDGKTHKYKNYSNLF